MIAYFYTVLLLKPYVHCVYERKTCDSSVKRDESQGLSKV
jgi:hypothetical protein